MRIHPDPQHWLYRRENWLLVIGPGGPVETMTATESFWIQTLLKRQQVQENFSVSDPDPH
jgi:hypothetical protein